MSRRQVERDATENEATAISSSSSKPKIGTKSNGCVGEGDLELALFTPRFRVLLYRWITHYLNDPIDQTGLDASELDR